MNQATATNRVEDGGEVGPVNREWLASIIWDASPSLRVRAEIAHIPSMVQDGRQAVLFDGMLHNRADLEAELSPGNGADGGEAALLLRGYRRWGMKLLDRMSG